MTKYLKQIRSYLRLLPHLLRRLMDQRVSGPIVVLPHEGLGDLISILPAIQFLSSKEKISLICDIEKWRQLVETFEELPEISVRHFVGDNTYKIPSELVNSKENLIALGWYSRFPIIRYPRSFYFQMHVPLDICRRKLKLKPISNKYELPGEYIFIDLSTSKGINKQELNKYICKDDIPIIVVNDQNTLRVKTFDHSYNIYLNKKRCFCDRVNIAMNAREIVCSDAALFNAIVRLKNSPPITVMTRNHAHSHDKAVYRNCRFDGGVHAIHK